MTTTIEKGNIQEIREFIRTYGELTKLPVYWGSGYDINHDHILAINHDCWSDPNKKEGYWVTVRRANEIEVSIEILTPGINF